MSPPKEEEQQDAFLIEKYVLCTWTGNDVTLPPQKNPGRHLAPGRITPSLPHAGSRLFNDE